MRAPTRSLRRRHRFPRGWGEHLTSGACWGAPDKNAGSAARRDLAGSDGSAAVRPAHLRSTAERRTHVATSPRGPQVGRDAGAAPSAAVPPCSVSAGPIPNPQGPAARTLRTGLSGPLLVVALLATLIAAVTVPAIAIATGAVAVGLLAAYQPPAPMQRRGLPPQVPARAGHQT